MNELQEEEEDIKIKKNSRKSSQGTDPIRWVIVINLETSSSLIQMNEIRNLETLEMKIATRLFIGYRLASKVFKLIYYFACVRSFQTSASHNGRRDCTRLGCMDFYINLQLSFVPGILRWPSVTPLSEHTNIKVTTDPVRGVTVLHPSQFIEKVMVMYYQENSFH